MNSWINIHEKTGETLEHFHNHTDFVVTAYIRLPKDTGYIEFRAPLEYHRANTWIEPELQLWKPVRVLQKTKAKEREGKDWSKEEPRENETEKRNEIRI